MDEVGRMGLLGRPLRLRAGRLRLTLCFFLGLGSPALGSRPLFLRPWPNDCLHSLTARVLAPCQTGCQGLPWTVMMNTRVWGALK